MWRFWNSVLAKPIWRRLQYSRPHNSAGSPAIHRDWRDAGRLSSSPFRACQILVASQLWAPISFTRSELALRGDNFNFGVLAKLKRGVGIAAANADVALVAHQISAQFYPADFNGTATLTASVTQLRDIVVGPAKTLLYLLLGAVGLLLLIACANVANLLFARGAERQKEIAVRIAMGAGRSRLVRQLLVESALLGIWGGGIGIAAAYAFLKTLLLFAGQTFPRTSEVTIDARVLLFAFGTSVLCSLIFGMVPALAATNT